MFCNHVATVTSFFTVCVEHCLDWVLEIMETETRVTGAVLWQNVDWHVQGSWFYSSTAGRRDNRSICSLAASIQEGI